MAHFIQEHIGTCVLMGNTEIDYHPYDETVVDDLQAVVDFAIAKIHQEYVNKRTQEYI